jgi:phage-related protein
MATFPSITPTYGQQKKSAPNTRTVRFADGYEHRILFGLAQHQNPKIFNLKFEVSETDADTIETFLDARANDSDSFTFTPPGESSSSEFVCEGWNKSIPYNNRATIQATFRQVFEPAS